MKPTDATRNQRVIVADRHRGTIVQIVRETHNGCKIAFDNRNLGERWTPWTLVEPLTTPAHTEVSHEPSRA